jgi:CubicO group peptidase (beta-lactamase class C family)
MRWVMVVAGLGILVGAASVQAQQRPAWESFDSTFRAYIAADGGIGASAVLVRDGRIVQRINVGLAARGESGAASARVAARPVTDSTLFHWGSITKTLTAVAIMQLRDRGLLSLDDRVVTHIPELRRVHDPYGMRDSITIRMLLSHTAGFQNSTWPYDNGRPWEPFEPTSWDQLVAMMPYEQLLFKPGTRYGYSNPAFIYLGRIIEQITGDPWESYIQKNIFSPLRLDRSYFRATPYYLAAHRSHNFYIVRDSASAAARVVDNGADFDPGVTTPNGGWNAPLDDLAAWAAFLTNSPRADAAPYDVVLKRALLEEMWREVQPMGAQTADGIQSWMGLSFFVVKKGTATIYGHTGSQAGFRSFIFFNPLTRTAVVAAFNTTNSANPSREWQKLQEAAYAVLWNR